MVTEGGLVENRIIDLPIGLPASSLVEAGNFLTARLIGRTLDEARADILTELESHQDELNTLTTRVVEARLAPWDGDPKGGAPIVRDHNPLLADVDDRSGLARIRSMLATLEPHISLGSHIGRAGG